MRPSDPPNPDDFPPTQFRLGKVQLFVIGLTLLGLSPITVYLSLNFNGNFNGNFNRNFNGIPPLFSPGFPLLHGFDWCGLAVGSAIGLAGFTVWMVQRLTALRHPQPLENTLRPTHAPLETRTQGRTAQLSATNALLMEEVRRTRAANLALEISESRLKMALDATQTVIWDLNLQTGKVVRSGDMVALFGETQTALAETQAAFLARVHPEDRERTQQTMLDAIAHQTPLYQEYRVVWDDGSTRWLADRGHVHHDRLDGSDHMMGTTINITPQKWLEEELRLTQEFSQVIVEASSLAAGLEVVLQRLCAAIGWNFAEAWMPKAGTAQPTREFLSLHCVCCGGDPRLQDFIQASRALSLPMHIALPGRVWAAQQPEWLLNLPEATLEQFIRVELVQDTGLKTSLGVPILVEGQTIAIFLFFSFTPRQQDDRVTHLVGAITDRLSATIQRKRVEEKLQESHALMQTVFSSTPDPIFVKDLQGRYRLVNEAAAEIIGRPAAEILGQADTEVFSPEIAQALCQIDQRIITTGITEVMEEQVPHPDGKIHYLLTTKGPWRNALGEAIGIVGLGRDITDRVQARSAIRQLNQELEQRVRERTAQLETANKELQTFSYSVSHDLRSPLRSIDGFSQILLTRYHSSLDSGGQHYLQRIRANVHRMGELIDDLLRLSQVTLEQMKSQPVNLSAIAHEIASQLSAPDRAVEWTIAPESRVQGDPRLLKIVLENLLGNAWKYTAQTAIAQIEWGVCPRSALGLPLDSTQPDSCHRSVLGLPLDSTQPDAIQPDELVYFVRDNGAGFNMAYLSKLFVAFQRLHSAAEFSGTGIGLATVARIVHRHGGQVGAIGAVGQGATFYFTLPDRAINPAE